MKASTLISIVLPLALLMLLPFGCRKQEKDMEQAGGWHMENPV